MEGLVSGESQRDADGGFLRERSEREADGYGKDACCRSAREIEDQSPQGEGDGEEVRVGECALREPDRIERREERGRRGDGDLTSDSLGQAIDGQEGGGGDDQLGEPGGERGEAGELPPKREVERGEWRVCV